MTYIQPTLSWLCFGQLFQRSSIYSVNKLANRYFPHLAISANFPTIIINLNCNACEMCVCVCDFFFLLFTSSNCYHFAFVYLQVIAKI